MFTLKCLFSAHVILFQAKNAYSVTSYNSIRVTKNLCVIKLQYDNSLSKYTAHFKNTQLITQYKIYLRNHVFAV